MTVLSKYHPITRKPITHHIPVGFNKVYDDLMNYNGSFGLMLSIRSAMAKYGKLTDKQWAAIAKCTSPTNIEIKEVAVAPPKITVPLDCFDWDGVIKVLSCAKTKLSSFIDVNNLPAALVVVNANTNTSVVFEKETWPSILNEHKTYLSVGFSDSLRLVIHNK